MHSQLQDKSRKQNKKTHNFVLWRGRVEQRTMRKWINAQHNFEQLQSVHGVATKLQYSIGRMLYCTFKATPAHATTTISTRLSEECHQST